MPGFEDLPHSTGCTRASWSNGVLSQAAIASAVSFTVGGIIPLLGGVFIGDPWIRLAVVAVGFVLRLCMLKP